MENFHVKIFAWNLLYSTLKISSAINLRTLRQEKTLNNDNFSNFRMWTWDVTTSSQVASSKQFDTFYTRRKLHRYTHATVSPSLNSTVIWEPFTHLDEQASRILKHANGIGCQTVTLHSKATVHLLVNKHLQAVYNPAKFYASWMRGAKMETCHGNLITLYRMSWANSMKENTDDQLWHPLSLPVHEAIRGRTLAPKCNTSWDSERQNHPRSDGCISNTLIKWWPQFTSAFALYTPCFVWTGPENFLVLAGLTFLGKQDFGQVAPTGCHSVRI